MVIETSVGDPWKLVRIRIRLLSSVILRMQKNNFFIFFSFYLPAGSLSSVLKFNFFLTFCVKILFCKHFYFSPFNTFMRKGKDPDPELDPYLWLMDPEGPKICRSGQCCGSGSGIRDWGLFDPWIRDPGSGIGLFRIPDPRSLIPDPGYFWELSDNFLGKKFHNSLKFDPNFFLEQFKN